MEGFNMVLKRIQLLTPDWIRRDVMAENTLVLNDGRDTPIEVRLVFEDSHGNTCYEHYVKKVK